MEARISRKELEESVQLTKAAKRQAEATARQGETVMVFTVVTIVFVSLPLEYLHPLAYPINRAAPVIIHGGFLGNRYFSIPK